MNYRSIAQLSDQVLTWSRHLHQDFDLIVGVPRSGLLVANLFALYRNLPFTDVEGLFEGRVLATGRRFLADSAQAEPGKRLKVLVLDDSVWGGRTMQELKERIAAASLPHKVCYGAVYVRPGAEQHVDFYCEVLEVPRIFEWNVLQSRKLVNFCLDIDGVLCSRPSKEARQDSSRYEEFLATAPPLFLPTKKVGWLVTSRSEKYRALTEEWLARHAVEYGELIMRENGAPRISDAHGVVKAEAYRRTGAELFIESSLTQSLQIANLSLKPVFCVDTMQIVYPMSTPRDRFGTATSESRKQRLAKSLRKRLRAAGQKIVAQFKPAGRM